MRHFRRAICASLLLCAAHAGAESSTSPGKTVVFASTSLVTIGNVIPVPAILAATLAKGKRKHVLQLSVYGRSDSIGAVIVPRVNGRQIFEPNVDDLAIRLEIPGPGTGGGEWWLDIDAAEAAFPGEFVGQPLVIEILAGHVDTSNVVVSLRAELVKRK